VARHFHPAPFAQQLSPLVDDEGAALDAADLSSVQELVLDHAEGLAGGLLAVGQELEWKLLLGLEAFVRLERVARDAVDVEARTPELPVQVAKIAPLRGAAGRVVLGVEVQDQALAALALETERVAAGAGKTEVRDRLAERFQRF
jgi:hypothetical protein